MHEANRPTKFYLVTGFLGAGKTTFLKEFVRLFEGERLAVLVNEFGREDVDGVLLSRLGASLQEVHSGSIFCACRAEQFSHALTALLDKEPDTLVAETSGLSDPTRIRSILAAHPRAAAIEYRGCVCVADAARFDKAYDAAMACRKQLAVCDTVVINKTDLADARQIESLRRLLLKHRPDAPVLETVRGAIPAAWADRLRRPALLEATPGIHTRDLSLQSRLLILRDGTADRARLEALLRALAPAAYRIKGFVRLPAGVFLAETVGDGAALTRWDGEPEETGRLVLLSGNGLPLSKTMEKVREEFSDLIASVE